MQATGIGSLPGDDIDAALALVFTELPDFPHLAELPTRGPGADMVGRSAAALVDLHVDLQPSGWRLVARPGLDLRRARDLLERDIDALVPVAASHDGPLKVQLCGPWTLCAALQTDHGPVLADPGAVRDVVGSLAEGAAAHMDAVRRRAPHAQLTLQLDEPSLPAVLAGDVPTASGLSRVRAIAAADAQEQLRTVVEAIAAPVVVHCCARAVPFALVQGAGAAAVSFDLSVADIDRDALAAAVEAGLDVWGGLVPSLGPGAPPAPGELADPVRRLWHELGFAPADLVDRVVVTPTCGLAHASIGWARSAYRLCRQVARVLADAPEQVGA